MIVLAILTVVLGGYWLLAARRDDDGATPLPDAARPTARCTLWFIGSSTIARWVTLSTDMAPWDAHRRGVNGALIPALTTRLASAPSAPPPAVIVFYAGENDIAAGQTPQQTLAAFDRFLATKVHLYGHLPVVAVSLKPSPSRFAQRAEQTAVNDGLIRRAARRSDLHFVEIRPLMLKGGHLGPFYGQDGLHMNAAGYARWVGPILQGIRRAAPASTVAACDKPVQR